MPAFAGMTVMMIWLSLCSLAPATELQKVAIGVSNCDVIDKYPWPSRDPSGRLSGASISDVQDWFFREGFIQQKFPLEKLFDASYAEAAEKALGPFTVENKSDTQPGCR